VPRRLNAATAVFTALTIGCGALHHPRPLPEPSPGYELRRELASWVVGVREPRIRYTDPSISEIEVVDEVRDAAHLIGVLRSARVFADVDFTRQLDCAPNLELVVRARNDHGPNPKYMWLWPATLTLVMAEEEGVAFTPTSDADAVFEFPYPTTLVIGVLPLLFSPILITGALPTWSFMSPGHVDRDLRSFLLSNADRLKNFARDGTSDDCHAR